MYQAQKRGIWGQIRRIKHKKEDFGVRYNVSSAKKRILELDTTYQALKKEFSCFRVAQKGQMEVFHASAWRGKTKWRIFVLPRGAERPNGEFSCFRVARKDQKEVFHASARRGKTKKEGLGVTARRRKTKKRFQVLQRGAERPKRDFRCYSAARKDLNKLVSCCRVCSLP